MAGVVIVIVLGALAGFTAVSMPLIQCGRSVPRIEDQRAEQAYQRAMEQASR